MSTNINPLPLGIPQGTPLHGISELDISGANQAFAAGLPDPAVLTRLANELFSGTSSPPSFAAPSGVPNGLPNGITDLTLPSALPSVPNGITPAIPAPVVGVIGEPELQAIAQSFSNARVQQHSGASPTLPPGGFTSSIPNGIPSGTPSGIPGGITSAHFANAPSFGFLEHSRSIFDVPKTASSDTSTPTLQHGLPQQGSALSSMPSLIVPTETNVQHVDSQLPTHSPSGKPPYVAPVGRNLAAPQIFGTVAHPQLPPNPHSHSAEQSANSLPFVSEARSITVLETIPSLVPFSSEAALQPVTEFSSHSFDVNAIRRDFPILQERVNGRPLIWLDNAATTQKPKYVIDRISYFYEHENSNVHRAAHTLAARATDAFDAARDKVRRFLNASTTREIIFVRGATEGINLVAQSWGRRNIQRGDEIVVTHLEHHANIVPWQMLCAETGAKLRVAPVDDSGQVLLDEYEKLLNHNTRLVAFTQVSNALGTVTPVKEMVAIAHRYGAKVLVDGAQSVSHLRVDVQEYDCDFFVFSGHKVFAPTGIGVVYGKLDVLESMPPWQGGGNMIVDVTFEKTVYHPAPARFEAGTGSIADAVGLGAAIDYLDRIGMVNVSRYEHELLVYATEALQQIPGLRLIGTAREKASVLSFVLEGFRTEDVGYALNQEGIAVRSGHHCAQPILRRFGLESTVRPSLAFYNTFEEIDTLASVLWKLKHGRTGGLV